MKRFMQACPVLVLLFSLVGCGGSSGSDSADADGKPVVYATNYPLAYFAERIAGDTAQVRFPEIDGDPAFWQPSDKQVAEMQGAALILMNGAAYEKWAKTVSLPDSKTADTSAGFADRYIEITENSTHSHGKESEHSHAGTAFTTWMDIDLARQQALAVRDTLIKAMPDQKKTLEKNTSKLLADLATLHEDMQSVTAAIGDRPLVASHPVYQYFARQHKLNIASVLWEPETVPKADDMKTLKAILADHAAGWMIWEGEPAAESVELLKAIGVKSVVVDPSGNRPDEGDWLTVMRQNIENLQAVTAGAAD